MFAELGLGSLFVLFCVAVIVVVILDGIHDNSTVVSDLSLSFPPSSYKS